MKRRDVSRRDFLTGSLTGLALVGLPDWWIREAEAAARERVTQQPRRIGPNDRINIGCIGPGGPKGGYQQGLNDTKAAAGHPGTKVVAVCDVDRDHRENAAKHKEFAPDCAQFHDFRELLARKDIDAVVIGTPDHWHTLVSIAAMRAGKDVYCEKPLTLTVDEGKALTRVQQETGAVFQVGSQQRSDARFRLACELVRNGRLGKISRVDVNIPNAPTSGSFPTAPVPDGFDWNLWLGPSLDRPYHPNYTHTNFRGWYEFGGGSIADMGHYSLWPIFQLLELDSPISVESTPSHICQVVDHQLCKRINNDYSFPAACTVRMRFAPKGNRHALDIFWYDGGIKPPVPEELMSENKELAEEGMMFVGDKGKILGGFRAENSRLIPETKMRSYLADNHLPEPVPSERGVAAARQGRDAAWVNSFKGGPPSYGDFQLAGPLSDAVNLASISLRLGGKRLLWDSANAKITNLPDANKFLTRKYRPGWEI